MYEDQADSNEAVPYDAYKGVNLTNLTAPVPGEPFRLHGDYIEISELDTPDVEYPTTVVFPVNFAYLRRCDAFEAVMCYHHITKSQLYIQTLDFMDANNRRIEVDPHALDGEDNSKYVGVPFGAGPLLFGEGGVDDAEDGDIILHEYGHAVQDNQTTSVYFGSGENGFGNETTAMAEGFGDYWAFSAFHAQSVTSGFDPAAVGEWDATDLAGLRRVDRAKVYPSDMVDEIHEDGEIWSRALWDLFGEIGKTATDVVVLQSHVLVPEDPTFSDGAEAILAADELENSGANEEAIVDAFVDRGIFRELVVTSQPNGVLIITLEADVLGDVGGNTPFERYYAWGDTVTLIAPQTHEDKDFVRWEIDGAAMPDSLTATQVVLDHSVAPHTAHALYDTTETGTDVADGVPLAIDLGQSYPNPFNPSTTIVVALPHDAEIDLSVYDVRGRLVRNLKRGREAAGYRSFQWDGRNAAGEPVSSGVYLYRLRAGSELLTRKMVLLK
jgi:hypothetical protein